MIFQERLQYGRRPKRRTSVLPGKKQRRPQVITGGCLLNGPGFLLQLITAAFFYGGLTAAFLLRRPYEHMPGMCVCSSSMCGLDHLRAQQRTCSSLGLEVQVAHPRYPALHYHIASPKKQAANINPYESIAWYYEAEGIWHYEAQVTWRHYTFQKSSSIDY